ncbi:MAG: AI-2E family transporter [Nitrospinaceae bacterium]|nr:AI-2E family transporter [Nitrospina sp.]MBT5377277.1 AI-2E family transporter [Nitrospinaceae bacterium]
MNQEKNKNLIFISFFIMLGVCILLYFSRRVIAPFFIAFALAYLLDPLVDRLVSFKLSRTLSVLILMLTFFLLALGCVLLLIPVFSMQAENLAKNIPTYVGVFQQWMRPVLDLIHGLDSARVEEFIQEGLSRFGELPMKALQFSSKFIWGSISNLFNIILMLANLVIIPVVMFYLLRDFDAINNKLLALVPPRLQNEVEEVMRDIDQVLSRFVRGQLMVAGLMGLMYSAGLFLCDTPMSLSLGMMAGLFNIVPYLGLILGLVPSVLLTYIDSQEWLSVVSVVGVFAIAQAIEGMVITPRVVGDNIGLHPVAVILAVLLGGELFGIAGMILGVPGVAVINVLLSRGIAQYKGSTLYSP